MNKERARMAAGLAAAAALLAMGCGSPSEIVIVIGAEPELALEHVRIVADSGGRDASVELDPRAPGAAAPPWTLGVSGRAGEGLTVRVTATTDGGSIEASARARFVAGERRVLYLYLAAACLDVDCPDRTSCDFASGACVDDERPTCELPAAFPQGPPPACVDPPPDAGTPDAQVDAGQDGGMPLPRPARCESGICAISAGARHACALRSSGEVLCWGGNDHGELSDLAGPRGSAARVAGVDGALEVAAGGGFTCALTEIDRVVCWGDNRRSQLGSAPGPSSPNPISVAIPTSAPPVAIDAGDAFACALTADRSVFCWGDNARGQLAITPSTTDRSAPVRVELPFAAEGLTAGAAHACAWGQGQLFCWGDNARQQVNGTSSAPTAAEVVIPGATIESAAAGRGHTCAIVGQEAGASVFCWGDNERGQCGGVGAIAPAPRTVAVVEPRALTAGGAHTCALVGEGGRVCWGHNAGGALAVMSSTEIVPAPSAGLADGAWQQLSAGDDYTCGVADGIGRCWGWDLAGAAGRGALLSSAPMPSTETGTIRGVALGAAHSCAIVEDQLRCWGGNALRQLGAGGSAPASTPADVFGTASSVAAGAWHTCYVDDQVLRCVGANHSGQSGQPATTFVVAHPTTDPLLTMVASVTAGAEHTCVTQDGSGVLCWGRGDAGQLGIGVRDAPTPEPQLIPGAWSAPSAGAAHTCAIDASSHAECWGANDRGQLGRPASPLEESPARAFSDPVDAVVSGGRFTCAFSRIAGRVFCVGADDAGQLGDGEPLQDRASPIEIVAPGVEGVTAGARHACWWSSTEVSCWGANERGQAGRTGEPYLASPTLVSLPAANGIVRVAAGEAHTCAVIATGAIPPQQLVCWGSDEDGRLGIGRALVFNAPESVVGL